MGGRHKTKNKAQKEKTFPKLSLSDYIAIIIATLETVFLPLIIIIILVLIYGLFFGIFF